MTAYYLPTKIIFGERKITELPGVLQQAGVQKPLLVCGRHFAESVKYTWLEENLGYFDTFLEISANPTTESVDATATYLKENKCDAVIGIGGGSVLDAAKVAACMKGSKAGVESFYNKKNISIPAKNKVPFFSLPTTSGSGSEVTKFSVLTTTDGAKKSLHSNDFYAKTAIVDPELTYTCPPETTAASGIDAFCQAIEAYWSRNALPETDEFAEQAIKLAYGSLVKAVKDPDRHVRGQMALASLASGRAFSNTGTSACHTLSYAFTKHYGLVHGFAVAITLPWFLRFYSEKRMERCLKICDFIGSKTIDGGVEKINGLMKAIGAPTKLDDIGCPRSDFPKIIEMSMRQKSNNPRNHTKEDLQRMLNDVY